MLNNGTITPLISSVGPMKRVLYYAPFCPFSRAILFGLREKNLAVKEMAEKSWEPSNALLKLTPHPVLPTLVDETFVCVNHYVISEYLDEAYPQMMLVGKTLESRMETRRLTFHFHNVFYTQVYMQLFYERTIKRHVQREGPDTSILKKGRHMLRLEMDHMQVLTESRTYLNGFSFSWADMVACAYLSCIDYVGDVPWNEFPSVKEWYMKIKSRPAFRAFLMDRFFNLPPSMTYTRLDF